MWAYILAVLSREENHDVLVVANVDDASRDEFRVGGVVDRQNWLSVMLREREEQSDGPGMQSDCWQVYEQSSATAAIAFIHVCTRVDDDGLRAVLSWKLPCLGLFVGSATAILIITRLRLALCVG